MNNFYTLIYLTRDLNYKFQEHRFSFSYSPYREVWEAYLDAEAHSARLVFSTNSTETALFVDSDRPPKKSNVTSFFKSVEEKKIRAFSLADNDRFISMHFEDEQFLLFQLFGNKPNVFLIENGLITESFKNNRELAGQPAPQPRPPAPPSHPQKKKTPKGIILALDPKFPRHLIDPVTEHFQLEKKSPDEIESHLNRLTAAMLEKPEFRVLENGNLCLLPGELLPAAELKTFDSAANAIRFAYYNTSRVRRLSAKMRSVKPKIERTLQRYESAINQLRNTEKTRERSKQYEEFGHLLMAHAHEQIEKDTDKIEVVNFYDDNRKIAIPVNPMQSIAENAQHYYKKSSNAIKEAAESKRRLAEIEHKYRLLSDAYEALKQVKKVYEFEEWYTSYETLLGGLGVLSQDKNREVSPYKKETIEGYEIWIGKNAKSNDLLTADAHKEDVWLHARDVSGSHVVIRMNNHKQMPPKSVILKAAAVAAWHSKARGAGLVPVIITKKKYITKPKGAAKGSVRVHKEEVELVEPQKM